MPEDPQSFFPRWRVASLLGVLVVVVLVVVREVVDHFANSPIDSSYLAVINGMSLHSPRARQRLEQYYAKHQRQTVASKHYPLLCNEMQKLTRADDVSWRFLPDKRGVSCPTPYDFYEEP